MCIPYVNNPVKIKEWWFYVSEYQTHAMAWLEVKTQENYSKPQA